MFRRAVVKLLIAKSYFARNTQTLHRKQSQQVQNCRNFTKSSNLQARNYYFRNGRRGLKKGRQRKRKPTRPLSDRSPVRVIQASRGESGLEAVPGGVFRHKLIGSGDRGASGTCGSIAGRDQVRRQHCDKGGHNRRCQSVRVNRGTVQTGVLSLRGL